MSRKNFDSAKKLGVWRRDNQSKYDLYDIQYRKEQSEKVRDAENKRYDGVSRIIANELLKRSDITAINYVCFYPVVEQIISNSKILSQKGYTKEDIEKITLRVLNRYNVLIRRLEDEEPNI